MIGEGDRDAFSWLNFYIFSFPISATFSTPIAVIFFYFHFVALLQAVGSLVGTKGKVQRRKRGDRERVGRDGRGGEIEQRVCDRRPESSLFSPIGSERDEKRVR